VAARNENTERLHQGLARLPEEYRRVIVWRIWEEASFVEIGQRLDRTEDAARMLYNRALQRLRQELGWDPAAPESTPPA
jgi:RNA polymerase sigma factor (sigma-70 family)